MAQPVLLLMAAAREVPQMGQAEPPILAAVAVVARELMVTVEQADQVLLS